MAGPDPSSESSAAAHRLLTSLIDGAHLVTSDVLATVVADAAAAVHWHVTIYLADYEQRRLVPLPITRPAPDRSSDGTDVVPVHPEVQDIEGSIAGRAFRTIEVRTTDENGRTSLWVPLLDGVERLGVINIMSDEPIETDGWRALVRWFAHLIGHLVAGKSETGDFFHLLRSGERRTVASELIWSLLPPLMIGTPGLVIAGLLEPSHSVAGDVFDYAVDANAAKVAIIDATGHDLGSAVIGALSLAAYRNSRRRGANLVETAEDIDAVLVAHGLDTFATGVIGDLDIRTGHFRYVNAGHPSPLLLRAGKVVRSLDDGRRILLGARGRQPTVGEEHLEPGDWVVFYTDGIPEARDVDRQFFGVERFIDVLERCAADRGSPAETVRRVTRSVLEYQRGILQDDATILVMEWASATERRLTA